MIYMPTRTSRAELQGEDEVPPMSDTKKKLKNIPIDAELHKRVHLMAVRRGTRLRLQADEGLRLMVDAFESDELPALLAAEKGRAR
jgi:hypothetical protein